MAQAVPQLISFQGRIQVGGNDFTGIGRLKFALVDAQGATSYWSNDGTSESGSEPAEPVELKVQDGLYSVLLGDATIANMAPLPIEAFSSDEVFLRIWFDDGVNSSQLLQPDQRIAAVGYAIVAATAHQAEVAKTVPDGTITADKIADRAIESRHMSPASVTAVQLAPNAVTSDALADGAIGFEKLPPGAAKFEAGVVELDVLENKGLNRFVDVRIPFSSPFIAPPLFSTYNGVVSTFSRGLALFTEVNVAREEVLAQAELDLEAIYVTAVDIPGKSIGSRTSLTVVGRLPAIAFRQTPERQIRFVRALDEDGRNWGSPTVVVDGSLGGDHVQLLVVNDRPAVCFYDTFKKDLRYVRALDNEGRNWGESVLLDEGGDVGILSSMAIVDGRPAIAYYDTTNSALKYIGAADSDGASWNTPVVVDSDGSVGAYAKLIIADGNPAIGYRDATEGTVNYARSVDSKGTNWGSPISVDSGGFYGLDLKIIDGAPTFLYDQRTVQMSRRVPFLYLRAVDSIGEEWGIPQPLPLPDFADFENIFPGTFSLVYLENKVYANLYGEWFRSEGARGEEWTHSKMTGTIGSFNYGTDAEYSLVNGSPATCRSEGRSNNAVIRFFRLPRKVTIDWITIGK
ncbi:MAG: exo-alpha-sialidase [Verrucomicrobiae bacterium]|nr:exo-alpha-sialidase [Verrucomicrobiae bacterium]